MPGLVPGIHVLGAVLQGVDGRVKPGQTPDVLVVPHPASSACQSPLRTCSAINASIRRRISSMA